MDESIKIDKKVIEELRAAKEKTGIPLKKLLEKAWKKYKEELNYE